VTERTAAKTRNEPPWETMSSWTSAAEAIQSMPLREWAVAAQHLPNGTIMTSRLMPVPSVLLLSKNSDVSKSSYVDSSKFKGTG
jgi:hypothetical protein